MKNIISTKDEVEMLILAKEKFSKNCIEVKEGQQYNFKVNPNDKWMDWFINKTADGFNNIFLRNSKKRLKDHKCFLLCGTIGRNEDDHFPIGKTENWIATKTGTLYFFANDHPAYYKNNKGSVTLYVRRIN